MSPILKLLNGPCMYIMSKAFVMLISVTDPEGSAKSVRLCLTSHTVPNPWLNSTQNYKKN